MSILAEIGNILGVINSLNTLYETFQDNKALCKQLCDYCFVLRSPLQELQNSSSPYGESSRNALVLLKQTVDDCVEFVNKFGQKSLWRFAANVVSTNSINGEFISLINRLQSSATILNVGQLVDARATAAFSNSELLQKLRDLEELVRASADPSAASAKDMERLLTKVQFSLLQWRSGDGSAVLGRGAFGCVYASSYDGSPCAVKHFPGMDALSAVEKRRIIREMRIMQLATVNAHIIGFRGASIERSILVMELAQCSLSDLVYHSEISSAATADAVAAVTATVGFHFDAQFKISALRQLARALRFLHLHGVRHRDVKPANALLVRDANAPQQFVVKLADFGVAVAVGMTSLGRSKEAGAGTDLYMAPEVLSAAAPTTTAADLFAFGVLANELFTYQRPWISMAPDLTPHQLPMFIARQFINNQRPALLTETGADATLVRELIGDYNCGCWAEEPVLRPSAADVVQLLESHVQSQQPQQLEKEKQRKEVHKNQQKQTVQQHQKDEQHRPYQIEQQQQQEQLKRQQQRQYQLEQQQQQEQLKRQQHRQYQMEQQKRQQQLEYQEKQQQLISSTLAAATRSDHAVPLKSSSSLKNQRLDDYVPISTTAAVNASSYSSGDSRSQQRIYTKSSSRPSHQNSFNNRSDQLEVVNPDAVSEIIKCAIRSQKFTVLSKLLRSRDSGTAQAAAEAIRNIPNIAAYNKALLDSEVMPALILLLQSNRSDAEVVMSAVGALWSIATNGKCEVALFNTDGFVPTMVDLIYSNHNDSVLRFAVWTIVSIAYVPECRIPLFDADGLVPALTTLLQSDRTDAVMEQTTRVFLRIAEAGECLVSLSSCDDLVLALSALLQSNRSDEAVVYATQILDKIAQFRVPLLETDGVLTALVVVLQSDRNDMVVRNAAAVISNIAAAASDYQLTLLEADGLVPALIELLQSNRSDAVVANAAAAVANIACAAECKFPLLKAHRLVPALVLLLQTNRRYTVVTNAVLAIGNIAYAAECKVPLLNAAGLVPALITLLQNNRNDAVVQKVEDALAILATNAVCRTEINRQLRRSGLATFN